jgi:diguanylate cyclase (GGDEF)-like protein
MVGVVGAAPEAEAKQLQAVLSQWGTQDLVASLAAAAHLFRKESEARIARLQAIQKSTMLAALTVLLIEALLIFLPAQVSVNVAIRRLEYSKRLLRQSLAKLHERNRDLVAARQSLTHAANHDALTGLLNRRAIYEHMSGVSNTRCGGDIPRCVMKIDLDHFKAINDSLGHKAGDEVLRRVAAIIEAETRAGDAVGRIGGDEFVVMVDNPPSGAALQATARRIIDRISHPLRIDGLECRVGASVGYTLATSHSATPDQLLIEADLALYEAKRAGRSQARAYSSEMLAEIEGRRLLFKEITRALSEDQFIPFLQPQVFTETGEIYGCEVLARWHHPERGMVPPGTFIAAAEEAGLVEQIDRIIISKGLDALERLLAAGIDLPSISVNASPPTLRDPHLADRLLQEVAARHLSPGRLTIEVLESTLIENDDDVALRTIKALSEAGFKVVLDDFGTGYASMSTLSLLHLDGIKLDQSLVKPVPEPRADSIIAALVALSRSLDMNVVAEGVETPAHFDAVFRLGCDVMQGYGIGKPMDVDDFIAWHANYSGAQSIPKRAG